MRRTGVLIYLSAAALVAAVVGEVAGWPAAPVQWLLLAWTVLLLPLCAALFRSPMRTPAWGLFLGFWGTLAVLALIVLQSLAVAGVLQQPSATSAESWPLAVFGLWVVVTSLLGAAPDVEGGFAAPVLVVGALAGLALLAASAIAWTGGTGPERPAFFVAAVAYIVWTAGLSGELWSWGRRSVTRPGRSRGRAGSQELERRPEPAAAGVTP